MPPWLDGDLANWLDQSQHLAKVLEAESRGSSEVERAVWDWVRAYR